MEIYGECEELVKLWEKSDKNDLIEHDITKLILDNYNNKDMFIIAVKIEHYEADLSDVICIYNNKFINYILNSFYISRLQYDINFKSWYIEYLNTRIYIDKKIYDSLSYYL